MFAEKLKELIIDSGRTAYSISKDLDISQASMSFYLNNKREPTLNVLNKIANYFQCSVDYLVGNENDFGVVERGEHSLKTQPIKADEMEMLKLYRALTVIEKAKVIGYIQSQYANHI